MIITRDGKPVAKLAPVDDQRRAEVDEVIERIKSLCRQLPKIPLEELLEARHEGHKY